MPAERERYIRPLVDTAETVEDCDEACCHLRDALAHANGEFRDMVREDLDALLERRWELSRA